MARLNVAVRLCCICSAYAALTATQESINFAPATGVGFRVKVAGCGAPAVSGEVGCKANSTAIFKVKDASGAVKVDTFCTAFDAFVEEKTSDGASSVSAEFFYAFAMTAGDGGSYWMSNGCFQDDASVGHPSTVGWSAILYSGASLEYLNQPAFAGAPGRTMGANETDVYIPKLQGVTPHSVNEAFTLNGDNFRQAQFAFVGTGQAVSLYFSEPVTGVEGKKVYLYEYTPGQVWTATATVPNDILETAATAGTPGMLGTKAAFTFSLKANRLYKVLMDAGAFADSNGNAVAGLNGQGTDYASSDTNQLVVFAVPMTLGTSNLVTQFPAAVAGSPVNLEQKTTITRETNVVLEFSDAVEPGQYSSANLKMTFGSDLTSADLVIGGSAASCFAGTIYCHKLFSSTYYILEPLADLDDSTTTWNATEVTISFPSGTFDYVNAFSYTFLTNSTEFDGRSPEILAYQFASSGASYMTEDAPYYGETDGVAAESDFLSWGTAETLVLYFDTKVSGDSSKYVTFTPETYATATAKTITTGDCFTYATPTALAPCKFNAASALVTVAASTATKFTINPGKLIPGQTYNVTVDAGAFVADGVLNGATAAWHTSFYVAQTVKACTVSDSSGGRLHRTSSIKLTFDGPIHLASGGDSGAITVGTVAQAVSNPDVVYRRNNAAAAGGDHFMIIIEPRQSDVLSGMEADTEVSVDVGTGILRNFAVSAAASLCNTYTTLYEDLVAPELVSISGLTGATTSEPYGFSQYGTTTQFTLQFSEKVAATALGTATLTHSSGTKTFALGGSATAPAADNTGATVVDRTVTLSVTGGVLDTGAWTLSVPYTSLTDMATETGVDGNSFTVSSSHATITGGAASATAPITVGALGGTAPTCTVASSQVVQGTSLDYVVQVGTISRTLILQFSEGVQIRDTAASVSLYAVNRSSSSAQKVLGMSLGGALTCEAGNWAQGMGCDFTTGSLEFDWMRDACSAQNNFGCTVKSMTTSPGGGHYLFLFLQNLYVSADFSSYYFKIEDSTSIVTMYDYPLTACATVSDTQFTVFDPSSAVRTGVSVDIADDSVIGRGSWRGSMDNILLSFNEKVKWGLATTLDVATVTFKTTLQTSGAGTSYNLKPGNHTHGVVLSASRAEAVVHVPYTPVGGVGYATAFDYLTVTFADSSFVDLSLTATNRDKTNETTADYNSTVANRDADPNSTWATGAKRSDTVAPKVLMMLPGGASGNMQVVTGINISAPIYLIMSENVSIATAGGVKLIKCGEFLAAGVVTGFAHAPLTSPVCSGSNPTEVAATLSLLDNTFGSSVVQVTTTGTVEVNTKYLLQVAAGTFTDQAATPNGCIAYGSNSGDAKFEFFTEGSRTKPIVNRYEYLATVSNIAISQTVMTVWFNTPIGNFSAAIASGLQDAGASTNDVGTMLHCQGGFKCTVTTTAAMEQDTTYLVSIPTSIYDRESDFFAGEEAAVSFKTTATDSVPPRVAFCSDVSVGSQSVSLKLGFTEAVVLYGGYTATTDNTDAGAYLQDHTDNTDRKSVTMELEAAGTVVKFTSGQALTSGKNYDLFVAAGKITDAAANNLLEEIRVNGTGGATMSTVSCATNLATTAADTTAPTTTSTLPAASATTVHDGDHVVFSFNEEVTGVSGASLMLTKCGVQSAVAGCVGGASVETIAAVDLQFGSEGNAMWQISPTLEQGMVYELSAPIGTFADLGGDGGNSYGTVQTLTFQVALESWDYRGTLSGASLAKATAAHANTVASFASGSRLGVHEVDSTIAQTLSLYFAQKVTDATLKVYLNATVGDHYVEKVAAVTGGKSLSMSLGASELAPGKTYTLEAYVNDVDWSTNVFADADAYYTYFGNYKASTAYYAKYPRPESTRFSFATSTAAPATWYGAPTLATDPFKVGWGNQALNASANVSTSAMIEVEVSTNSSITWTSGSFTVQYAARISASTLADSDCSSTFKSCCATTWVTDASTQSKYVDYSATAASSVAKVYFSLEGGLMQYKCYRVSVSANAFSVVASTSDTGPASTTPAYTTWFTTDNIAAQTDYTAPTVHAFAASSQGSGSTFRLVAKSAYLTVDFGETITAVDLDLVAISGSVARAVAVSGSGNELTITPSGALAQGTVFTLTISPGAVKDAADNYFSSTYTQTFMTVYDDSDTPTVLHSLPESTDTASTDARMVLFMSERVSAVSSKSATIGAGNPVDITQSTWAGFQDGTDTKGVVVVEDARVTFATHTGLAVGAAAKLTVESGALADKSSKVAALSTVTFTAATFGSFTQADVALSATYGGDPAVSRQGATAVTCGETFYLVGGAGGSNLVRTWAGSGWTEVTTTGLGGREDASVAVDQDCKLWVVGGKGSDTNLAMSADFGASFTSVEVTPLPVDEVQVDATILVQEGTAIATDLTGASVAVVNGWQVVVCGGGLAKCWICKDANCAVAGRSAQVPAVVQNRYFGSMLVVDGDEVYFLGGQDAASAETQCYQSVYMWNFANDAGGASWEGMAAQMDLASASPIRCESAYAQAGDGMIAVVGGNNATTATKGDWSIGALSSVLKAARPLLDSTDFWSGWTYASTYARPVLFAQGPTSTTLAASSVSEPVVLAFSEPVQASTGCVEINAGYAGSEKLYCSTSAATCYTTACGGTTGVAQAGTTVSIARSIVTIDIGSMAKAASRTTAWAVSVTLTDNVVKDVMGNGFLASAGSSTRGAVSSFSFGFAAAAAAFSGATASPAAGETGVALNTNIVFDFNRDLSESTSILAGFSLKLLPAVGTTMEIAFDENSTDSFSFAGDILKVGVPSGTLLIPGMAYTATLAGSSVKSADGSVHAGALSQSFTAHNGPASAGVPAGVAYTGASPVDDDADQNDTTGTPTVVSSSPLAGMTGVSKDSVHVVYTFSEAVRLHDVTNQSNGVVSQAFALQFYNTSSAGWEDTSDLAVSGASQSVFVDTTAKTITVTLTNLASNTGYRVKVVSNVIADFKAEPFACVDTLVTYSFTTVGSVAYSSAPKVVASYVSPTSGGSIILDDDEMTEVMVVFNTPLAAATADGLSLHTFGGAFDSTVVSGEVTDGDVLSVNISDFSSVTTAWNLYVPNALVGANFVNMTAEWPTRVKLVASLPKDTGATYDKFSDASSIVLEFSEQIQAGSSGTVSVTAELDTTNSLVFSLDAPEVSLVGKYLVIETDELMAGEKFQVSMGNGTVRGVSTATNGRAGIQEGAYGPSTYAFATVPKINFQDSSLTIEAYRSGVAFGPDNALYVIGGERSGADSNETQVSLTYRDTDAAAGFGVPSRCTDPCAGTQQTVIRKVYGAPSTRGLRPANSDGVAHSVVGVNLEEAAGGTCKCPRCIYEPPSSSVPSARVQGPADSTIPVHGYFFHDGNAVYTQASANAATVTLTCDVGLTDLDSSLAAGQGYVAAEPFTCTVAAMTDPLAEYFGVWSISETACAEKACAEAPNFPAAMFAGSDAECNAYSVASGNSTTFSMPHGDNCTVSCNPGYEGDFAFQCDRGIYSAQAICTARTCTHADVENGQFVGGTGSVAFPGSISVECATGHTAAEVGVTSVTCEATDPNAAESIVALSGALACTKKACDATPPVPNGAVVVDQASAAMFGATAAVECESGYFYGTAGTRGGVLTCDDDSAQAATVGWSGVTECTPLTCDVQLADFANAQYGSTTSSTLSIGGTISLVCSNGYGTDPADSTTTELVVACSDVDAAGVAAAGGGCAALNCDAVDTVTGNFGATLVGDGCTADAKLAAGTTCTFQCAGGTESNEDFTYVTCKEGTLSMCTNEACSELFPVTSSIPACVSADAVVKAVDVIRSEARINLAGSSARRLSAGLADDLTTQIDAVLRAFSSAMAKTLGVATDKVVVESHSLNSNSDGSVDLVVNFYVEVEAGSTAIEDLLTEFASGGGDLGATLTAEFQAELEKIDGVTVTVGDVTVSTPVKGTVYVEEEKDAAADEDEEGGGSGAIIAVVVVVVLVILGVVVYKFVLNKN